MFIQFIKMTIKGTVGAFLYVFMQICRCISTVFGWLQTQACRGVTKILPENTFFVTIVEKEDKQKEICKIEINWKEVVKWKNL